MNGAVDKAQLSTGVRTRIGWRFGYLFASFGIYMVDQTTKAWAVRTLRFDDVFALKAVSDPHGIAGIPNSFEQHCKCIPS